jgi:hypothetical protein
MGPTTEDDSKPDTAAVGDLEPSAPASKVTWVTTPSVLAAALAAEASELVAGTGGATAGAAVAVAVAGAAIGLASGLAAVPAGVLAPAAGAACLLATDFTLLRSEVAAAGGEAATAAVSPSPGLRRALLASRMMRMGPAACRLARSMAAAASAAASGLAGVCAANGAARLIASAATGQWDFLKTTSPKHFTARGPGMTRCSPCWELTAASDPQFYGDDMVLW